MYIGLLCVLLAYTDSDRCVTDRQLTITLEFFDWRTKKEQPAGSIPAQAKPAASLEFDVTPGKPFSGKVTVRSKVYHLSGVIDSPVEGKVKATLQASLERRDSISTAMTTIRLPLGKQVIIGGGSSGVTGPAGVSYSGTAFRVTVDRKKP